MPDNSADAGNNLRSLRLRAMLSQEELAFKAGVGIRTVRDIELGRVRPQPRTLRLLVEALDLDKTDRAMLAEPAGRTGEVPRELPRALTGFADWDARRDALLTAVRDGVAVVAVHGMAGVGKTALVVQVAHVLAPRYPDGQLFVDLHGSPDAAGPRPSVKAVLTRVLRGFEAADRTIPVDVDELTARYRSVLASRRVLLVLDNASSAEQVEALLPGTPDGLVLVTSRRDLSSLAGAYVVPLGPPLMPEAPARTAPAAYGRITELAEPRIEAGAPAVVVPRELPADVIGFTGRAEELRDLESARLGDEDEGIPPSPVVVISGMAGVGKTASAVHWAHRIADDYPDGQLFLNLRGYSPLPALQPIEALTAMLRSLGLDSDQVPAESDQAAARLRTETAGKRMLILLDNAESADQVVPLFPGGPRSLVIVTSRNRLGDLHTRHGAFRLGLAPLTPDEATRLLKALLRIPRSSEHPELDELARSSGYLPLALRIAAANWVGGHVVPPHGDGPHAALKATFDGSYRALADDARRMLRLLGIVPVRSLAVEAATVLTDMSMAATERAIEQLVHAHMVNRDGRGRLYLHDLIRDYANDLVEAEDPVRVDALNRLFDWYLGMADAACSARYPRYARLSAPDGSTGVPRLDEVQAEQWLDDERENLVAVARYAAEHGFGSVAWMLADTLRGHAWMEMSASDFLALGHSALNGALADASLPGEAVSELCLSTAYIKARDFTDVVRHAERAIERSRRVGWEDGQAAAHHDLALACWNLGRLRTALEHGEVALAMNRAFGKVRAASVNLGALAVVHGDMGALQVEMRLLAEALGMAEEIGDRSLQASHLRRLASVSTRLGLVGAADYLDQVMNIEVQVGERKLDASTAEFKSAFSAAQGRYDDALAYAEVVVRQADLRGDRMSKAIGLIAVAVALNGLGRHEGAVAAAAQSLLVVNGELTRVKIDALIERAVGRIGLGDLDAAEVDADLVLNLAREGEYRTSAAMALNLLAEVCLRRGAVDGARELAGQALEDHRSSGHRVGESWSLWILGSAARDGGDDVAARRHWSEVEQIYATMGAPVPERFAMTTF
jgi:tetratricopeptide (TPR) repeat protein/transcriptional regulator with XRE-family HTH domain